MAIGALTYIPDGRFALLRSYADDFVISIDVPIVQDANTFHFTDGNIPTREYYYVIEPRFWAWSSNRYTLDFIMAEVYYLDVGDPVKHPLGGLLEYRVDPVSGRSQVVFYLVGIDFLQDHTFPLPEAPPGYWLPKSLP